MLSFSLAFILSYDPLLQGRRQDGTFWFRSGQERRRCQGKITSGPEILLRQALWDGPWAASLFIGEGLLDLRVPPQVAATPERCIPGTGCTSPPGLSVPRASIQAPPRGGPSLGLASGLRGGRGRPLRGGSSLGPGPGARASWPLAGDVHTPPSVPSQDCARLSWAIARAYPYGLGNILVIYKSKHSGREGRGGRLLGQFC